MVDTDQNSYMAKLIIETTMHPDFKSKMLQHSWGVMGAENLLDAIKGKMLDGEYADLCVIVTEINGYDKSLSDLVEEAKTNQGRRW